MLYRTSFAFHLQSQEKIVALFQRNAGQIPVGFIQKLAKFAYGRYTLFGFHEEYTFQVVYKLVNTRLTPILSNRQPASERASYCLFSLASIYTTC